MNHDSLLLDYIEEVNTCIETKDKTIQALHEKVASANRTDSSYKTKMHKLASVLVDKLVHLGAVDTLDKEASVSKIEREPDQVIVFLEKLASTPRGREARHLGTVIKNSSVKSSIRESDRMFDSRFGAV